MAWQRPVVCRSPLRQVCEGPGWPGAQSLSSSERENCLWWEQPAGGDLQALWKKRLDSAYIHTTHTHIYTHMLPPHSKLSSVSQHLLFHTHISGFILHDTSLSAGNIFKDAAERRHSLLDLIVMKAHMWSRNRKELYLNWCLGNVAVCVHMSWQLLGKIQIVQFYCFLRRIYLCVSAHECLSV